MHRIAQAHSRSRRAKRMGRDKDILVQFWDKTLQSIAKTDITSAKMLGRLRDLSRSKNNVHFRKHRRDSYHIKLK